MTTIRKYTNRIEEFLHSDNGQRFFNIAYSVGAAIVIWGALFKILHLPGGNTLLCVGMGTEIAMFLLTAFDRPPKEPNWEEIVPALGGKGNSPEALDAVTIIDDVDAPSAGGGSSVHFAGGVAGAGGTVINGGGVSGGVVVVGGGGSVAAGVQGETAEMAADMEKAAEELSKASDLAEATNKFVEAIENISKQMSELNETMSSGSNGYAERMADLNRNLAGLNTIYEIQLRSMSGQLEAIDRVNRGLKDIRDMYEKSAADSARYCEESEKMAHYMHQINAVYARMISAMTLNPMMPGQAPAAPVSTPPVEEQQITQNN